MRLPALTCLCTISAHPAWAQAPIQPAPAVLPDVTVSAPEPRYVAPTTRDRIGTSHSALTRRVVDDLALPVEPATVLLRGADGVLGAQRTVGHLALRQALLRGRERREVEESIVGVTQDVQKGTMLRVPPIAAGKLTIRSAGIAFADLHMRTKGGI